MFSKFITEVQKLGHPWNGNHVYFKKYGNVFEAFYKPKFPKSTEIDIRIQAVYNSDIRGRYEIVKFSKSQKKWIPCYGDNLNTVWNSCKKG